VEHKGEMPDEDAILDNEDLIRKLGQEATRWQKRALKLLGSIIDNLERVPNKDKPAVMERIKELHGMVINGVTKRRSGQAKPSCARPLLPDRREEN
jgi:polyhydroxyalkanoate synthesis regulator phasin